MVLVHGVVAVHRVVALPVAELQEDLDIGTVAVAEDGAYVVALVTALTPDLVQEGVAREFVRRVQDLRKAANLDVADRIHLYIQASSELQAAITTHRDYVTTETLAVSVDFVAPPVDTVSVDEPLDSQALLFGVARASRT